MMKKSLMRKSLGQMMMSLKENEMKMKMKNQDSMEMHKLKVKKNNKFPRNLMVKMETQQAMTKTMTKM